MTSPSKYSEMTNEALLQEYDRLWRRTMYYMAAEGNWSSEAKERGAVKREFWDCEAEVVARGLK